MLRQLISTLIALSLCYGVFGQHDFGLKLNGGLSYLSTVSKSIMPQPQKFYWRLSGQCGLFYQYNFNSKILVGAEVLFVPIYGKEYQKLPFVDISGNFTGEYSETNIYRHIYNLGIPVYFGYSFKKLNVNLGVQTNFVLASGGIEKGQGIIQGQLSSWNNQSDKLAINSYDFGARLGLLYQFSNRFSIDANYFYGLTNIIDKDSLKKYWTWKVQQVTIGLRYKIFSRPERTSSATESK